MKIRRRAHRRSLKGMAVTLALMASVVAFGIPASAVHDDGFALQGDVDHASLIDWVDLFDVAGGVATKKAALPAGFIQASFSADHIEPDPSAYATGSKDIYKIGDGIDGNPATGNSGWQCKESNNIGSKFNLVNAYAAAFRNAANQLIVTFGSEITSPNGNRNAGVWLLQDQNVGCTPSGGGGTNFAGVHKDGDVFIVSAFTGGGDTSNVTVYKWVGNEATGSLVLSFSTGELNDAECDNPAINDAPISDKACAIVNKAAEVNPPWNAPDADGGDLNVNEFYEGAVNLTALGLPECFANVLANSRSSQEPGSTLHDFAAGSFQTCNPSTTMLNTAATASPSTVVAGQSTTLTFYEKNDGDVPLTNVSVTTDNAGCNANIAKTAGDTLNDNILGPGEEWTFTCTTSFSTTGTKTVTATGTGTSPLGVVTFCAGKPDLLLRHPGPDQDLRLQRADLRDGDSGQPQHRTHNDGVGRHHLHLLREERRRCPPVGRLGERLQLRRQHQPGVPEWRRHPR